MEIEHKGVLLGVRGKGMPGLPTYREETRRLKPGSTLVFYTDGLATGGSAQWRRALRRCRGAADAPPGGGPVARESVEGIAQAAEQAVPGEIDDDMAIVVVRTSAVDLATWEGQFPAEPIRVSQARRRALETFESGAWTLEQAELACLLVSEVVTNVVLHAAVLAQPAAWSRLRRAARGCLRRPRRMAGIAVLR